MQLISSSTAPLQGQASLPGDKSLSHRAALFAALAEGESQVENFLSSGVTRAMLEALSALCVPWQLSDGVLRVQGGGLGGFGAPKGELDCGNSATTLRLLAGALAASGTKAVLSGSPGLCRRPMGRIVTPLRQMGVALRGRTSPTTGEETAPLSMDARPAGQRLNAAGHRLQIASAQVKSCLLLAGLAADGATTVDEPGPSRDHTERMLRSMGVQVSSETRQVDGVSMIRATLQPPSGALKPLQTSMPGDFSSAAFLIVAALITPGSEVTLRGVGLNPLRTGLLEALGGMGAQIELSGEHECSGEPVGDLTVRHSRLHGTCVAGDLVVRMIDEFPIFAVAAACADGWTEVHDAAELRHKESDRITALCSELQRLGVQVTESSDGFILKGGKPLNGGTVQPHGDHRLAMSLAVAGLAARQAVVVREAEILSESFPGFIPTLRALGAGLETRA